LGKDVTINNVTIYKDTRGEILEYDKTMYVEGYQGNYEKAYYITGKIKSDVGYEYLIITFNIKDRKGNILGTAVAGFNNVNDGEEKEFKALSTVPENKLKKIYSYEVKDIRGE
jgi:hypothetical protein